MSSPAFLQGFLQHERGLFGKVAGAVIEDGLEHRPDPKARTARQLIEHLLGHNLDIVELIDEGIVHHRNQVEFETLDEGLAKLDESFGTVIDKLGAMDQDTWMEPGTFMVGDQVIAEMPRQQIAWMLFLDSIHHRGQLSTYLRPMGSSVPSIYGPSADDQGEAH